MKEAKRFVMKFLCVVLAFPIAIFFYIIMNNFYYNNWGRWSDYNSKITKKYNAIVEGRPLVSYGYKVSTSTVGKDYSYCYVAIFNLRKEIAQGIEKEGVNYLDEVTFDSVTENEKFWDSQVALNPKSDFQDVIKTKDELMRDRGPVSWFKTNFPKLPKPKIVGFEEGGITCLSYLDNIQNRDVYFVDGSINQKETIRNVIDYGYYGKGYLQSYSVFAFAKGAWFSEEVYNEYTVLVVPRLNLVRVAFRDGNAD